MNGTTRALKNNTGLNRASFIWVNSESKYTRGTNNDFSFDLSNTPFPKNTAYNVFIKNITYPNMSNQITALYNYNKIFYQVINATTSAVVETRSLILQEGTYDSAQLVFNLASLLNQDFGAQNYGDDTYSVIYNDIQNRIQFRRESKTAVSGVFYNIRLLTNDANSKYDGEPGFGLGYVLGLPYNSTFNLPADIGNTNIATCPSSPQLQPYLYMSILLDGISNQNVSSDTPNISNIVYRCPLSISSSKYSYIYVEENNPDFSQMLMSQMPSAFRVRVIDQYGNAFPLSENSSIDVCLKIVPIE